MRWIAMVVVVVVASGTAFADRRAVPRWCSIAKDGTGLCSGPSLDVDELVSFFDDHHCVAEVRVVDVRDPKCDLAWRFSWVAERGNVAKASGPAAISDPRIDFRKSKVVPFDRLRSPSGRATDQVIYAVDRDGDGREDVMFTRFYCDDDGTPNPRATGQCHEIWNREGARMRRAYPTLLPGCEP
jgi:hypothetical protein